MKRSWMLIARFGTIGLSVAKQAKEVRGMDTVPQAIADAKKMRKD